MLFKVKSSVLVNAIDAATVGGGKGFVLMVSAKHHKVDEQDVQLANLSSSDGEKVARANIFITSDDLTEDAIYYPSAAFKAVVNTLAKVADVICIEPKGAYLELSDEKRSSVVRVDLLEKDMTLALENKKDGCTAIIIDRKNLQDAISIGGSSAKTTSNPGTEGIFFHVDAEKKELVVLSYNSNTASRAVIPIVEVQKGNNDDWYIGNSQFIRQMSQKLSGEKVMIGFTPKFIQVQSQSAIFGCKRMVYPLPSTISKLLAEEEYEYKAKISKKDLQLGIEIATVGCADAKVVALENAEDGSLCISSMTGENKTRVSQAEHEGEIGKLFYQVELLKSLLGSIGDEFYYFGKDNQIIHFSGSIGEVAYTAMLTAVNPKKM